jgi:hypothetical protein
MHARARTRKWQPHPYRVAVSSVNHGRGSGTRSMVQHLWRHASARCWERPPRPRPASSDSASSRGRRSTWARNTVRRIPRVSARTVAALATRRQPAGHRPQPRETPPAGSSGHHRIGRTSEAPDDGPRAEPPTAAQRAGHTTAPPVHLTCTARAAAASVAVRSRAVLQRAQVRRATVKPNPSALRYGGYVPPTGGTRCTSRRQQGAGCVCVCMQPGGARRASDRAERRKTSLAGTQSAGEGHLGSINGGPNCVVLHDYDQSTYSRQWEIAV